MYHPGVISQELNYLFTKFVLIILNSNYIEIETYFSVSNLLSYCYVNKRPTTLTFI